MRAAVHEQQLRLHAMDELHQVAIDPPDQRTDEVFVLRLAYEQRHSTGRFRFRRRSHVRVPREGMNGMTQPPERLGHGPLVHVRVPVAGKHDGQTGRPW